MSCHAVKLRRSFRPGFGILPKLAGDFRRSSALMSKARKWCALFAVGNSYGAGLSVGVRTGGFRGFLKVLSKMTYTIGIRTSSNVGIYQNPRYENEVGLCL